MLQKALLITVPSFPKYIQQLMGCCSTENFQVSRWWAVTQYSYWYISMHHPFILCAGKSSLTFLPPELTKQHRGVCRSNLPHHILPCPSEARSGKSSSTPVFFWSSSLFQLLPRCAYSSENMQVVILNAAFSTLQPGLHPCLLSGEIWMVGTEIFHLCQGSL